MRSDHGSARPSPPSDVDGRRYCLRPENGAFRGRWMAECARRVDRIRDSSKQQATKRAKPPLERALLPPAQTPLLCARECRPHSDARAPPLGKKGRAYGIEETDAPQDRKRRRPAETIAAPRER